MNSNKERISKRPYLRFNLLIIFLLILVVTLVPWNKYVNFKRTPVAQAGKMPLTVELAGSSVNTTPATLENLTKEDRAVVGNEFDTWVKIYAAAPEGKRAELESEGVKLAVARRAAMLQLIETDPEQAIKCAVSVVQRRNLPQSVRKHVEEHISNEGQLGTIIATKFDPQPIATELRQATIGRNTYQAFTYGRRNDHRFDNKTIPLNGITIDNKFAVNESPLRVVEPGEFEPAVMAAAREDSSCPISTEPTEEKEGAVAVLEGSHLVYLCQGGHIAAYGDELLTEAMASDPDIAYSAWSEGAKTLIYISIYYKDQSAAPLKTDMAAVNAYFQTSSYNKTSITTTFTPAYQMSKNAAEYTSLAEIINEARALAAANGYNYTDYTLDTIRYNGGFGDFGGVAGVGGRNNMLKTEHAGVAAHEIGHNLGLWHANYWQTTDGTTIGSGSNEEYGNVFDVMGNSGAFPHGHFNACEKNILDWIPTSDTTAVTASGTYRVYAHDMGTLTAGNKYGITFAKDADRKYWLEYRQNSGWSAKPQLMNGVTLLWDPWSNSNNGSQLLDTTPDSTNGKDDAPIVLGRTFSDTGAGVHFTLKERGGLSPNLWADVVVNVGTFSGNAAPTFSLAASSTSVQANTVVNFTATASDANGDTLAYHWDFGDNSFGANTSTAAKSWATTGSRRVTCVVSDMKGGTATQVVYVNVVNSNTFAISGFVTNSGTPQVGAVISCSAGSATTDSFGYYAFLNVANNTYTLTPTLPGTVFLPTSRSVTVSGASQGDQNFTAATLTVPANGSGSGITREWWSGITGSLVTNLTGNAAYPNSPTSTETIAALFEAPLNVAESYGQRMHGYFIAPETGSYRFYIASDDTSELWLSTNSTTASAVKIASVTSWTDSREWSKFASQKSAAIALTVGQRYYIRALHKEGTGGDNLAVGVEYPNGSLERPIPFHRLDPWPSVSWTTATQASVNESGILTVTAQLSSVSPQNVTVPFTVTGTASGTDYTISASSITIAAGATSGTATITITADSLHEPYGETVILTMGTPTNAAKGAVRVHTATITDDDNLLPVVYAGLDYSVPVSSGTAWSPALLSPQVWLDATTATVNTGTVSIVNTGSGGGTMSGLAALTPNGISTRQTVTFTGGAQKLAGTYANTGATLNAFFVGKSSTVSQAAWSGMMSVWQTGQNYDYNNSVSAVLFGQNSSTSNSIYTQRTAPLSITTSGTLTNPFVAATVFDGSTNTLFLNGAPATSVASTGNFSTGNIVLGNRWDGGVSSNGWKGNFGEAIICNANLSTSDRQKIEGYLAHRWGMATSLVDGHPYKLAAPVNLTVNLDGTVSDGDSDPLTSSWTQVSGPATGTISSQSSVDTTATLSAAGTYTFRLTANDGSSAVTDEVVITVATGSSPPIVAWTSASQTSANESGTMTVTAQLSATSASSVTVPFTVTGTATSGDRSISVSPITITAGATTGTATITITPDTLIEPNETVILTMGTPTNASLGATQVHTATITDDDTTPSVAWTSASQSSANEAGTMIVSAQLSSTSSLTVTVPFTVTGTATSGDRTISTSPITIIAGATTGSATITITADTLDEPSETVILTMGTPTNATLGVTQVHTATITDDDATPTVAWTAASQSSANESGSMTVTAQLSAASGQSVSVPFTATGTATAADRSISASPITIAAGTTTGTATITITADTLDESDETVILTMGTPTNASLGTTQAHTATITDDDTNILPVVNAGADQTVTLNTSSAWSPSVLTPQLWLDADEANAITLNGTTVSQWNDKSGFNRHATALTTAQPTATAAGLNGKRVVTFDGGTDVLNVDLDFMASVSHSAFIVTKPTIYSNIYGAATANAAANSLHVGFASASTYRMNYWGNDYAQTVSANFVAGSANIMNYIWTSGTSKQILANGKSEGTSTSPVPGTVNTMSGGGRIGRTTNHAFFGGDIAEFIAVTGVVSAADREKMEGYLAHKWGLAGNLANAHPYKNETARGSTAVATLDGTATDTDTLTTTWSVVSGPAAASFGNASAIDTTATFTVAGTYTLRLTANDGQSQSTADVIITVSNPTPYQIWAGGTFTNNFTDTALASNPDGDSLTSFQEFAFGTDPTVSTSAPLSYVPNGTASPGKPILENVGTTESPGYRAVFTRRKDHGTAGISYQVEFSANLAYWKDSIAVPVILSGASSATVEAVSIPFPETVPLSAAETEHASPKFFRVAVAAQ